MSVKLIKIMPVKVASNKKISDELHPEIIKYYLAGNSTYKTGKKFGVSDFSIGRILKQYGVPRRTKALNRDEEIISLYESRINAPQIEALIGVSASHVYDVLRRRGIKADPYMSGIISQLTIVQQEELIKLYLEGKDTPELGKIFNVGDHWVRRFLKRNGIKLRPRGARKGASHSNWQGGITKNKEYRRKKLNAYNKKRRDNDPLYKMKCGLLNRMNAAFRSHGYKKQSRTHFLLGASYEVVAKHIADKFEVGMTWENHGIGCGKWNFDHCVPLAKAQTEEELISLFHYTNLAPMWWEKNLSKGSLHNGQRYRCKKKEGVCQPSQIG